jgi:dUTP pyrophosphatase
MDPLKDLKELLQNTEDGTSLEELFSEMGMDLKELEKQMVQKIDIEYINSSDKILNYAYESDSGFDLYSNEEIILPSLGRALVPTGIRFNVPENYEIQVRSKSGLAINRGLMVLNSPGTIDQGYTGEIKVILFNASAEEQKIEKGMKVAQAVISSCISGKFVNLVEVDEIKEKDRNENGFGSTGII